MSKDQSVIGQNLAECAYLDRGKAKENREEGSYWVVKVDEGAEGRDCMIRFVAMID